MAKVSPRKPRPKQQWFIASPWGGILIWTGSELRKECIRGFVRYKQAGTVWSEYTVQGYRVIKCTVAPVLT